MVGLFNSVPYGNEQHKLTIKAVTQFKNLGTLDFFKLVQDTYLKPQHDKENNQPIPLQKDFVDGIYLCSGQAEENEHGQMVLQGCGRRIYKGIYGCVQEGQFENGR